jgi:hypothetical protein
VLSFSNFVWAARQGLVSGLIGAVLIHHPAHPLLLAAFGPEQLALSLLLLVHVAAFYS